MRARLNDVRARLRGGVGVHEGWHPLREQPHQGARAAARERASRCVRVRGCAEQGCDATGDDPASSPCVVIAPLLAIVVISFVVYFLAVRGREGEAPPLS